MYYCIITNKNIKNRVIQVMPTQLQLPIIPFCPTPFNPTT
jgi:hypothetical protein